MEKRSLLEEIIFVIIPIGILFVLASIFNIVGFGLISILLLLLYISFLLMNILKKINARIKRLENKIKKLEKEE